MKIKYGVIFDIRNSDIVNGKFVIPSSVTSIGNGAFCYCTSLTNITWNGKEHAVKDIDGYCMEIRSSKEVGEYTIYSCTYFARTTRVYIAEVDGTYAHGKTVKSAISDLNFKLCKKRGIEQYSACNLDSMVNYIFYRVLTGACMAGTEEFIARKGLNINDSYTIRKVIEMTKGEYGHEQLLHNLHELEII